MSEAGLLFVLGETGPEVTEEEFNDWYDNEHAPPRLTVPGFTSAIRYKATDSDTPSWLAFYDIDSPSVAYSDAYKSLGASASERERSIISRLSLLNRRIYSHLFTLNNPTADASTIPGKHILIATMRANPEDDADFNKWYNEEHLGYILKMPGCIRGRRYKLVDQVELAGKADKSSTSPPPNYLAIYDFAHEIDLGSPEFKAAMQTPWTVEQLKKVLDVKLRQFGIHKAFAKPT